MQKKSNFTTNDACVLIPNFIQILKFIQNPTIIKIPNIIQSKIKN